MFKKLRILASKYRDFTVVPYDELEIGREHYFTKKSNIKEIEKYYCDVFQDVEELKSLECFLDPLVIKNIDKLYIVVDMFPNTSERFHRFEKRIPRSVFESCLHVYSYDKRPYLFLKDDWIDRFWNSTYSTYVFIDLIGFKKYMEKHVELDRSLFQSINLQLDYFVKDRPDVSIISVSDSVIIKKNWGIRDEYKKFTPEDLIKDFLEVKTIFKRAMGLDSFAVFTQGFNEFSSDDVFRSSVSGRHVSMLTSGAPFIDLMDIEKAAVSNQKKKIHPPCDCYFHEDFLLSINFKFEHAKWRDNIAKYRFDSKTTLSNFYFPLNSEDVLNRIEQKMIVE